MGVTKEIEQPVETDQVLPGIDDTVQTPDTPGTDENGDGLKAGVVGPAGEPGEVLGLE